MDNKQLQRYSRNILLTTVGEVGQQKFLNSKILVAGAGGLGSSVISNLASIGIGQIGIIDYDNIEISNLNRQFIHKENNVGHSKVLSAQNWIHNYNSEIKVYTYNVKLDTTNYQDILYGYDLVIDCFDSYESKFMLNSACIQMNKILIHGGVQEFEGQLLAIHPHKTACLSCIFPEHDLGLPPKGILSPIINIIGSLQVNEAIKIILDLDNISTNEILSYNCIKNQSKRIQIKKNPNCKICSQ